MKILIIDGNLFIENNIVKKITKKFKTVNLNSSKIIFGFQLLLIFIYKFFFNYDYIITLNDNSSTIQKIKILFKFKKLFSIQNGYRSPRELKKTNYKNYLDTFFCFGSSTQKDFLKNGHFANKFYFSGSLWISEFLTKKKITKKNKKIIFDICYISQWKEKTFLAKNGHLDNERKNLILIDKYLNKLQKDLNLKVAIALRSNEDFEREYFKNLNKDFYILPKNKFSTYQLVLKSNVILSFYSTVAFESILLKKKFLFCDFTKNMDYFPYKKGPWILRKKNYIEFKKKILNLIRYNNLKYYAKYKEFFKSLMYSKNKFDTKTFVINKIKKETCNK